MLGTYLARVRGARPLIHNITNYVTANDVANALLAAGASPVMADDAADAAEIAAACDALCINIGTLNARTIPAMFTAAARATHRGRPVVLDPVGAGASALRTDTARGLMDAAPLAVIRGNMSEIKALAGGSGATRGVDAAAADALTAQTAGEAVVLARALAAQTGAVVIITGATDVVANAARAYCITNGSPLMASVTGAGCQLSALIAAFAAVAGARAGASNATDTAAGENGEDAEANDLLDACAAAVCTMGIAGEVAAARMSAADGNATFRTYLIDAIYRMTPEQLNARAKFEVRQ